VNRRPESGFTLIELLIAVAILGIIIFPVSMAMVTGLTTSIDAQQRLSASRSPLFTSAFFAKDAQSAARNGITTGGAPACGTTGTNVISFTWQTTNAAGAVLHSYKVSYVLLGSGETQRMARAYCIDGTVHDTGTLAPVVGSASPAATATCTPGCTSGQIPRSITLTVSKPNGGTFVLSATRRTA
jgi:prepilin-type N-terminal cleavage/methylation domain-containing protein